MIPPTPLWFLIRGDDAPGTLPARLAARPAHLARLRELADAGRLKLAGPIPMAVGLAIADAGAKGSVVVAAFDSQQEAEAWVAEDPYVAAGVYQQISIEPFLPVLP